MIYYHGVKKKFNAGRPWTCSAKMSLHMREKRKHERFDIPLEVRVTWPDREERIAVTRDLSDGGAFLLVSFCSEPSRDTIMHLQLTSQVNGKDAPVLRGRIARTAADGTAFEFLLPPEETSEL